MLIAYSPPSFCRTRKVPSERDINRFLAAVRSMFPANLQSHRENESVSLFWVNTVASATLIHTVIFWQQSQDQSSYTAIKHTLCHYSITWPSLTVIDVRADNDSNMSVITKKQSFHKQHQSVKNLGSRQMWKMVSMASFEPNLKKSPEAICEIFH